MGKRRDQENTTRIHPPMTDLLFSYSTKKQGDGGGCAGKTITLQTKKMKVGFEPLWMNSSNGVSPKPYAIIITDGPTLTLE